MKDQEHEMKTSGRGIVRVFSEYMRRTYNPIQVDEECFRKTVEAGHRHLSDGWREALEIPITAEELKAAVFKGDSK